MKLPNIIVPVLALWACFFASAMTLQAPAAYEQKAKLITNTPGDEFGFGGAAIDGSIAVVKSEAGAHVFEWNGTSWKEETVLIPSDGAEVTAHPSGIAISGDTIVVGGSKATVDGKTNQGAAYVFKKDGTVWSQQQRLTASDGSAQDRFGLDVAIEGDRILAGAPQDDGNGKIHQGAVYVFEKTGGVWTQQAKILAGDGGTFNYLGYNVELANDKAFIGNNPSPGAGSAAVYVFAATGSGWTQLQRLSVCEPSGSAGNSCVFGRGIAVEGNTLAVGNPFLNVGSNTGGVYVFSFVGGQWEQTDRLVAPSDNSVLGFGNSVDIQNGVLAVGAPGDFGDIKGAVYIFQNTGTDWVQDQRLLGTGTNVWDSFGDKVSMSGNRLLVAAPRDSGQAGNSIGAAYIYAQAIEPQLVTVSGRIVTPGGLGLRNAKVTIEDSNSNQRVVLTSSLGYFDIEDVWTQQTYTVSVSSKRYRFDPITMAVNGAVNNLEFVGLE